MQKINVVCFRGLLGNVYSRGVDVWAARVAKLEGVDYITVDDYPNWRSVRSRISKWKDPTIFGLCHSFGANAATMIAESLPDVRFPLILTVDPSPYWSWGLMQSGPSAIGSNVDLAFNQYQTSGLIGRVKLTGRTDRIVNRQVPSTHTDIDDMPTVHEAAFSRVTFLIQDLNKVKAA